MRTGSGGRPAMVYPMEDWDAHMLDRNDDVAYYITSFLGFGFCMWD